MNVNKNFTFVFLLLSLGLVGAFTSIIEGNLSVLVFCGIWFMLGVLLINVVFPKTDRYKSIKLFVLFFVIYYLYMYTTHFLYVTSPITDFFWAPDSRYYYGSINNILKQSTSFGMIDQVLWTSRSAPAFGILSWIIGLLAYFIDANSMVVQKSQIVFLASMIVVFLYNMSRNFLDEKKAWTIALSYGLLTHLFFYSAIFLRDIHINFIYVVGFYVLIRRTNLFKSLLALTVLCLLVWYFRAVNGIFFLTFIGIYIFIFFWNKRKSIAYLSLGAILIVGITTFSMFFIEDLFENVTGKVEHYEEYHHENLEYASGLGAVLNRLPLGFQQGAYVVLSQISPFPFYSGFYSLWFNKYIFWYFPLVIAAFYWVIVWGFVWYGLLKPKLRSSMPVAVKGILFIGLLYIVAVATTSPETRRIICVYPAIYLFGSCVFYKLSKRKRQFLSGGMILLYGGLMALYLGLKIFF